jgi:hypothetical protein
MAVSLAAQAPRHARALLAGVCGIMAEDRKARAVEFRREQRATSDTKAAVLSGYSAGILGQVAPRWCDVHLQIGGASPYSRNRQCSLPLFALTCIG